MLAEAAIVFRDSLSVTGRRVRRGLAADAVAFHIELLAEHKFNLLHFAEHLCLDHTVEAGIVGLVLGVELLDALLEILDFTL